jgi:hypothetical protein
MARDKLRAALAELTKYREPTEGISHELFKIITDSTTAAFRHRTLAIVATSYLESALRKAITAYLHTTVDQKRIFEDELAPLRDFSARIRMARGLGVIDDDFERDLNWLRVVRNSFAHSVEDVTFDTAAVVDAFSALNIIKSETYLRIIGADSDKPLGRPESFVVVASILQWRLLDHRPPWNKKKTLLELIADQLITDGPTKAEPTAEPPPSHDR